MGVLVKCIRTLMQHSCWLEVHLYLGSRLVRHVGSMQPSSSAVESGVATEHTAAEAEITTCMKAIVTEWNTLSTDDSRDLVSAAQVLLKGDQNDVRNLCKPWGVQLREKKCIAP